MRTTKGLMCFTVELTLAFLLTWVPLSNKNSSVLWKESLFWNWHKTLIIFVYYSVSVQSLSHVQLFMTPWITARQASLSITNSQSLPKPMSIELVDSTISSSVVPFSSCPQSFPASGSFQWVSSSHQVAKVLEFQLQHPSFQWTPRNDLLYDGLVGSPCSPRDSRVFSNATVQKHQFFSSQLSL